MGLFSKFNVSTATKHRSNQNLSCSHYTTENFGQLSVPYNLEVVPGDKVHLTPSLFARVAPLAVPTYADVRHTLRCFYVPFRVVWGAFNDFITDSPIYDGSTLVSFQSVPTVSQSTLCDVVSTLCDDGVSASDADFFYDDEYYKHNSFSKFVLKVLYSLGYNFNWNKDFNQSFSALPLLAYFKVVVDYYTPSYIATSSSLKGLLEKYRKDVSQILNLTYTDLLNMFQYMIPYYSSDYFTSAWETPTSVVSDMPNPDKLVGYFDTDKNIAAGIENNKSILATSDGLITQQALDWLKSLNEFVLRNNYAGSRPLTRILARFGVKVDDTLLNMSTYIGSINNSLQVGEVVSTSSADSLGDYAGRAVLADSSDKTFNFDVKEHGMFICIANIDSNSHFVEGVRRSVMHRSATEFFTPEFEDTTLQAIAGFELQGRISGNSTSTISDLGLDSSTFGYTARYAEYKFALDSLTGDFCIPSLNSTIEGFVLPRNLFKNRPLDASWQTYIDLKDKVNVSDIRTQSDSMQYDRMFRDVSGFADPFYFVYNFHCIVNRPMKSLDNSTLLHDDPTRQPSVTINSNDIINS